jgi:hypothetical protein
MKYMNQVRKYGVGAVLMVGASSAFAALPAGTDAAIAGIQADGEALFALVFPVVLALLGLSVVISLTKRFGGKI